jgi:hypothetical protein
MSQKQRGKRRGPVNDSARPAGPQASAGGTADRYQKYLPEWMRGTAAAAKPARPRRARAPRPAGGYTPGKMASGGGELF